MAPHLSSELWQLLVQHGPRHNSIFSGCSSSDQVHLQQWPRADPALILPAELLPVVIQIQGRLLGTVPVSVNDLDNLEQVVKQSQLVQDAISGKTIKRTIVVKERRIVNFVLDK
eukprot:TRINITY_DN6127_c0_g2_i8.p1 TRINITY_DN6127_c0_g2~~TRINITY_DN6127_c0_g2_i8.p1  ORF type:complete len:114 (-),score=25.60 TRINITY_DN6127_c0_g2_i8:4-345(-)